MGTLFGCTHLQQELLFIMNSSVVFATLLAAACAAPQTPLLNTVNEGPQSGPLTPLVGNLVQTPKGLRPIDLEGFSEDLDQDGLVDPVVPAAPAPVAVPAPVVRTVAAPVAAPIVQQTVAAPIAAPVLRTVATAPVAAPVFNAPVAAPIFNAPVVRTVAAAPVPAPIVRTVAAAPAPIVRTVAAAPAPIVRTVAPVAPFVKTISPLPVPVRAAPSARVYDVRRHF